MALVTEEKTLEAQQDITRKHTKELNIGPPKLRSDPGECSGCKQIKIACRCVGGGGKPGDEDALEKTKDLSNARINPQLTPSKLVLLPSEKKASKEHLENSELYEIQEGKTPQDVLAFFNAHLNRLATSQNKTISELSKEGFSGKIAGDMVVLNFPNKKERDKFCEIAENVGLIKSKPENLKNSNSPGQQMLARMTNPQNRRGQ